VGNDFFGEDSMKKTIRLIAAGALLAAGVPLSAMAQTITINATVNSQCNLGTATVTFASLNLNAQNDNTGSNISLTCNRGATVSVALNNGLPANASGTQKRMQRGTTGEFINYSISVPTVSGTTTSCPSLPGTSWNATNTLDASPLFTSNGGQRQLALCVSVPAGQFDVGAGLYTDTVTATATF
jgi:spore coat protein U-like protein